MVEEKILMYGTKWCGDCVRARRFFELHEIPYVYVDVRTNKEADQYVRSVNNGNRSVPTIVFPDGSILVEPSDKELASKLRPEAS